MARTRPRTPAQWLCLLGGGVLLARGAAGFVVADSSFGTPGEGWHHAIHVVSGLLLLAAYGGGARAARAAAIGFGALYLGIAAAGILDGSDVFGLIAADAVDKTFHTVVGVVSLGAGLLSRPRAVAPGRPAAASGPV